MTLVRFGIENFTTETPRHRESGNSSHGASSVGAGLKPAPTLFAITIAGETLCLCVSVVHLL